MNKTIKVFILEDMRSFIDGFRMYVKGADNIQFAGYACNEKDCLDMIKNKPLDILLVDIKIGGDAWKGFNVAEKIIAGFKGDHSDPAIVFLTGHSEKEYVNKANELNCSFLDKYLTMPEILKEIETIYNTKKTSIRVKNMNDGGLQNSECERLLEDFKSKLTPRQGQVAVNVCSLRTNDKAAKKLNIAGSTIETHLKHIYRNLALDNNPSAREILKERIRKSGLLNYIEDINQNPKKWFLGKCF